SLLLGNTVHDTRSVFAYGALTHYGDPFQKSSTNTTHMPSPVRQNQNDHIPQHRTRNPCRVSHEHGLASSAFARHYSRNHGCFLFQWVLRCFTSPRSPQHPMNSDAGNASCHALGFPIRTPSDHSSVDNSPRTIAASHVLHRLLMPRHPPCALTHLTTTRCSHPLCNTQHTTTPRPHDHHHPHQAGVRRSGPDAAREPHPQVSPQDPTVCRTIRVSRRNP